MAQFRADSCVTVRPFASRREGQYITIGDVDRGAFVTIPAEGLDLLNALSAGKTVGQVVRLYEQVHGETPDVEDFLTALAEHGFVSAPDQEHAKARDDQTVTPAAPRISPAIARRLVGAPVVSAVAVAVAFGVVLSAIEPGLIPGPTVLVFHRHFAELSTCLVAFSLITVMLHEVGHLVAARASDVPARIGLSYRLWIVVAETDMSGIWLAAKRRRYLAFLAGPLIDAASAALLLGLLWADRQGWLAISPTFRQFIGAALWTYLARLLWQCCVFVRTDFYYVLATALDCKRLLADTEDLLRNQLARLRRRAPVVDQSAIPRHEQRAIRAYAVLWLAGRVFALASLVLITLPVLAGYLAQITKALGGAHSTYSTVDLVVFAVFGVGVQVVGLVLWIRGLYRGRTQRRVQ
jgi:putative peptide zinc metalloprotease protein